MHFNKTLAVVFTAALMLNSAPVVVSAAGNDTKSVSKSRKTFGEEEFLNLFSHKSRKQVTEALGKPLRIGQSSKPSSAESALAAAGKPMGKDKSASVVMWYYENLVRYDDKRTYKTVELTFVNDRCMNITYFNSN